MSDALTSKSLIESIKRRASIPENQSTFTTADFLEFANEELRLGVVPSIMSLHEDFFLYEIDIPLESNKSAYEIPSRAVGNKLRDVQLKNSAGQFSEMTRVSIGTRFDNTSVGTTSNLRQYYIQNNKVVFSPPVGSNPSGSITMVFYIKPSVLVEVDRVGIITGINRTSGEITLSSLPENFSTAIKYDFYKAESPHTILTIDLSASTINSTSKTVTFTASDIPDELVVGDHLAQAGEAIIPQVPSETQVMLSQMVACRVLESLGDTQGLQNALIKLQQMQTAMGMIIDNRVDDSPQKIVSRHGIVRTSVSTKRFNRK